jgi:flagellar FliL protein
MDKNNASAPENSRKILKSLKIFFVAGAGLLLLVVVGVALVSFVFSSFSSGDSPLMGKMKGMFFGWKKTGGATSVAFYKMEPFLVNLADPGQPRYLKLTLHVETHQQGEEFEKRLPQTRDSVLTILCGKNSKEVMTSEGKNALREEIKEKMNHLLTETKVRNIYFTEFVIQ